MIFQRLWLALALVSGLVSPLFGGTERGNRLISEAGGAVGIAGAAGPAGAPGIAGAAGAAGIPGIQGLPGAPGVLDYADFFTFGTGQLVTGGNAVPFDQNGFMSGGIVRITPSSFLLPTIGTYLVEFQVNVLDATGAQLQLRLDNIADPTSVVGAANTSTGNQLVGMAIVMTTTPNTVLEVINPLGGSTITLAPAATSGGTANVSEHLTIVRLL